MPMTKCERCGTSSYDGGAEHQEICPWCRRRKIAGSREEMAEHIRRLREGVLMTIGFFAGMSLLSQDKLKEHLIKLIKDTDDDFKSGKADSA